MLAEKKCVHVPLFLPFENRILSATPFLIVGLVVPTLFHCLIYTSVKSSRVEPACRKIALFRAQGEEKKKKKKN